MAFKTVENYNKDKFGGYFLLRNDGDEADVIFLYQSVQDVLVADVHYLKSGEYNGYVHCCGKGCPACARGIRTQNKLFIPVYNITSGEIQFWDRTMRFEPQLQNDVFSRYPNPSEYVFRIRRNGAAGDVNTTYSIIAIGKNDFKSYAQILAENNISMPDHYNSVCKDLSSTEMQRLLQDGDRPSTGYSANQGYAASYGAVPRGTSNDSVSSEIPEMLELPEPPAIEMPSYSTSSEPIASIDEELPFSEDEDAEEPNF